MSVSHASSVARPSFGSVESSLSGPRGLVETPATGAGASSVSAKGTKSSDVVSVPQGLASMWHGLTLPGFIRLLQRGPEWEWRRLPHILGIAGVSVLNSLEAIPEQLLYGSRIAKTQPNGDPIFLLGHWRSGTTLLHNLMSMDPQFTYPTLYHTMFPYHFLWTESWVAPLTAGLLPKTRPMDNVATSWSMTQEDEIALLLMCGVSPYLMMAFQNDRAMYGRYLELTDVPPEEVRQWKESLDYFVRKLTYRENKRVVLKSPSHTYRVPLLLEMYPNAKFVYIYREPYAVFRSSMHLRKTMFAENAFGRIDYSTNEDDCFALYEQCIRRYEATKHLIPAGQLHEIRFEDLEVDPYGEMKKVYESLSLPGWGQLSPLLEAKVPELTSYRKNRFEMDPELQAKIYRRLQYVFETYGYPSRFEPAAVATPA